MIEFVRPSVPTDNFTMVPNSLWTDTRLNGNAVKLVGFILSRPAGWRMNRARIREALDLGDFAFDAAVAKAESAGWLVREQTRDDGGKLAGTRYEVAFPDGSDTVTGKPGDGETRYRETQNGHTWKPKTGIPGNHPPISNTDFNTEGSKTSSRSADADADAGGVVELSFADEYPMEARAVERLNDLVERNGHERPGAPKRNNDAARLLFAKYDPREIRAVMDWALDDEFWRTNIRSFSKFRAQYTELRAQMGRKPGGRRLSKAEERWAKNRALVAELEAEEAAMETGMLEVEP